MPAAVKRVWRGNPSPGSPAAETAGGDVLTLSVAEKPDSASAPHTLSLAVQGQTRYNRSVLPAAQQAGRVSEWICRT